MYSQDILYFYFSKLKDFIFVHKPDFGKSKAAFPYIMILTQYLNDMKPGAFASSLNKKVIDDIFFLDEAIFQY